MITYDKSAFGLNLLFRVHGSAAYRAIIPGLLSVCVLVLIRYLRAGDDVFTGQARDENDLQHPYAIAVLVSCTTFLIVFRANQGYSRYWEAAGSIHQMMSKWLDATIHTGCYHMQCAHYDAIKPPSFFDYPELNAYYLTRDRERYYQVPKGDKSHVLRDLDDGKLNNIVEADETTGRIEAHSNRNIVAAAAAEEMKRGNKRSIISDAKAEILDRARVKSIEAIRNSTVQAHAESLERLRRKYAFDGHVPTDAGLDPIPLTGLPRLDGNWGKLFPDKKATYYQPKDTDPSSPNHLNNMPSFASSQGGRTPALFLQELAHLCSLLNAVALSTMRNDIEGSTSPLGVYKPGSPWPEVDPDYVDSQYLVGPWYSQLARQIGYFFGMGRSAADRTRYNAARPLEVLGGVSDAEIKFLQMARGSAAKTQLCWYWLTEFIIREHLNGSTGKVGPPIISRIIQFLSDGMIYYNHCRKIVFISFPFPNAQLAVIFVIIAIPAVAFLMDQYADNIVLASCLSFVSVAALSGIHEVARELENPFRNIPNELPLVTLQAQFNEALIVMYSGYHPDHFWEPKHHHRHPADPPAPRRKNSKNRSSSNTAHKGISRSLSADSVPTRPIRKAASHDGMLQTKAPPITETSDATPAASNATPSTPVSIPANSPILEKEAPATTPANPNGDLPAAVSFPANEAPATNPANPSGSLPAAVSSPATSPTAAPVTETDANEELAKLQAKMEEYGKEIERLRGMVSQDKKYV